MKPLHGYMKDILNEGFLDVGRVIKTKKGPSETINIISTHKSFYTLYTEVTAELLVISTDNIAEYMTDELFCNEDQVKKVLSLKKGEMWRDDRGEVWTCLWK